MSVWSTVSIPGAHDTAALVAFVREMYPLGDIGPYTTKLRTALHRLADRAEALDAECERAINALVPFSRAVGVAVLDDDAQFCGQDYWALLFDIDEPQPTLRQVREAKEIVAASADRSPQGGDGEAGSIEDESAVPKADAQGLAQ